MAPKVPPPEGEGVGKGGVQGRGGTVVSSVVLGDLLKDRWERL